MQEQLPELHPCVLKVCICVCVHACMCDVVSGTNILLEANTKIGQVAGYLRLG